MTEKLQLTKSDRKKVWWRSTFLQGSWNFEPDAKLGLGLYTHSSYQKTLY
ncbi:PTS system mannose-specific transporter subunit IID [Streptococcus pneumoniae]|nr:PTS system mannose-specific transporter subunit IID [Streptococcus pneumoniae]